MRLEARVIGPWRSAAERARGGIAGIIGGGAYTRPLCPLPFVAFS